MTADQRRDRVAETGAVRILVGEHGDPELGSRDVAGRHPPQLQKPQLAIDIGSDLGLREQ